MRRVTLVAGALLVAAALLTPALWIAHTLTGQRADAHAWCVHDCQELADRYCN